MSQQNTSDFLTSSLKRLNKIPAIYNLISMHAWISMFYIYWALKSLVVCNCTSKYMVLIIHMNLQIYAVSITIRIVVSWIYYKF